MIGLEAILAGKELADLPASPLQLAIARAADGRPLDGVLEPEALRAHFGVDELEAVMPTLVVLVCGVRSGKSFLAACAAIKGSLTADLSALKPHELPRFAIVAPTVDNARATFKLLVGIVRESKVLRAMVVPRKGQGEDDATIDMLTLRRPDGRKVEIVVVAAHRGAVTLRSRWLVGFVLDEVALFGAESTGAAVNAEELLRAGETRLVPKAQGWLISSPFGPSGLLYELWREHFGKPSEDALVVHAPTRAMVPTFSQKKIDAVRRRDADTASREYDAAWLDATTALLDGKLLDAATRKAPKERSAVEGVRYVATGDCATRGNAWTLVVGHMQGADHVVVDGAWQWLGSKTSPLSPEAILEEQAAILRPYRTRTIFQDHVMLDALRDLARHQGLHIEEQRGDLLEMYMQLRTHVASAHLELPPDPIVRQDLAGIRRKVTASGIRIELPSTANGRHSDYAPAIALLVRRVVLQGPGNAPPAKVVGRGPSNDWLGTDSSGEAVGVAVDGDGVARMVARGRGGGGFSDGDGDF